MRRRLVACLALGLAVLPGAVNAAAASPARPPNIVLIIGDDHGYPDFGFMGSPNVRTPRLDTLASEGVLLRTGYSTASHCAPALRSLLTGLHPAQWESRVARDAARRGAPRPFEREIELFDTLPAALARAGYATFMAGKFWEASYQIAGFEDGTTPPADSDEVMPVPLGRTTMQPVFDFIDAHARSGDGEGAGPSAAPPPFFLWFAPKLPHVPHDAPFKMTRAYVRRGFSRPAAAYYANIERFDSAVGRLLDHLDDRGLRDETLVIYLSDNGWDQGPHDVPKASPPRDWDGPNGKRSMYELGFRTPIVARWPGRLAAGSADDTLVSIVDLVPTLRTWAGLAADPKLPGRDLSTAFEGRARWTHRHVVGSMTHPRDRGQRPVELGRRSPSRPETAYFIRTKQRHYIWYPDWDGADELYDLAADPLERVDLSSQHAGLRRRLQRRIEAWAVEVGAEPIVRSEATTVAQPSSPEPGAAAEASARAGDP